MVCVHACMHACVHACVHVCVCACVCVHVVCVEWCEGCGHDVYILYVGVSYRTTFKCLDSSEEQESTETEKALQISCFISQGESMCMYMCMYVCMCMCMCMCMCIHLIVLLNTNSLQYCVSVFRHQVHIHRNKKGKKDL